MLSFYLNFQRQEINHNYKESLLLALGILNRSSVAEKCKIDLNDNSRKIAEPMILLKVEGVEYLLNN